MENVQHLIRSLNQDRNMVKEAVIGVVKSTDDPLKLGRVRCEFKFDFQGAVHLAWCLPLFSMGGLVAQDQPKIGAAVLVFFLDGNVGDPLYLGLVRGKPQKELLAQLSYEDRDSLHFVIHEVLLDNLQQMMQWMAKHTHSVTITPQGIGNMGAPIAGIPSTGISTPPREPLPKLKKMATKGLRLHPDVKQSGYER